MKDIYKNPISYYILVPVLIAMWPLFTWVVRLPNTERKWQSEKAQYIKAQEVITEILNVDPDRLDFVDSEQAVTEFDYAVAVEKVASLCRILPADYKLSSGILITSSGGQKSQNAKLVLRQVDMAKFAKFLSTIQFRWTNLQCTKLKLTKKKGLADTWEADLEFKYYY